MQVRKPRSWEGLFLVVWSLANSALASPPGLVLPSPKSTWWGEERDPPRVVSGNKGKALDGYPEYPAVEIAERAVICGYGSFYLSLRAAQAPWKGKAAEWEQVKQTFRSQFLFW